MARRKGSDVGMDWDILEISERTDIDVNGRFYRYKEARFRVGETQHTLKISMVDFNADKTREIVEREANKIISALSGRKK